MKELALDQNEEQTVGFSGGRPGILNGVPVHPHHTSRRDAFVPPAARRAVERALAEQERLKQTMRNTVRPISRRGPVELIRRISVKSWQDRILGMAAEAAFWQLMSLPPLFLGLLGSLGFVADLFGPHTVQSVHDTLLDAFGKAFSPNVVDQIIRPTVEQVLGRGRADVVSIGFVMALWAGSSATSTFVNTITIAYDMRGVRGTVRSRLLALWLYIASVAIGVVLLPLLVLGPSEVVDLFPHQVRDDVHTLITVAYWPAVGGLLLLGLTTFYRLAMPKPRRLPWRRGLPGALVAMMVFLLGGLGLRRYISFVVSRAYTYGTLAAPIAALLFFFLLALAVLIGAELNAAIEQMWPAKPTRRMLRKRQRHDEHMRWWEARRARARAAVSKNRGSADSNPPANNHTHNGSQQ